MDAHRDLLRHALGLILALGVALPAQAARHHGDDPRFATCIATASEAFGLPAAVIKVLIDVEGGEPGMAMRHPNGAVDLGVMQINTWWVHPDRLGRFGLTYEQIRDDACLNIYAGTWIFATEFERTKDLGLALAHYHSKTPKHQSRYLEMLAKAIERRLGSTALAAR